MQQICKIDMVIHVSCFNMFISQNLDEYPQCLCKLSLSLSLYLSLSIYIYIHIYIYTYIHMLCMGVSNLFVECHIIVRSFLLNGTIPSVTFVSPPDKRARALCQHVCARWDERTIQTFVHSPSTVTSHDFSSQKQFEGLKSHIMHTAACQTMFGLRVQLWREPPAIELSYQLSYPGSIR